MKKLLLASAAVAAIAAGSASAAENAFTGFNFGAQGGVSHHNFDSKVVDAGKYKTDYTGGVLGAFVGYGYQFENNVFLGTELEGNFFFNDETKKKNLLNEVDASIDFKTKLKTQTKYDLGLNAKLGYVFNDDILVYALAGINTTKYDLKFSNFDLDDNSTDKFSKSRNAFGYKVGAGIEKKFADQYFARAQYDYKMVNKKTHKKTVNGSDYKIKTDLDEHNFRLGLGMII